MTRNIKIIKRSERDAIAKTAQSRRVADNASARQAARDITGQVTTWIRELQQRHTPDPRHTFAGLFVDPTTSPVD
jgi:hypothetical protein